MSDSAVDAVKTWLDTNDPYGANHGYSAVDDSVWMGHISLSELIGVIREAIAKEEFDGIDDYLHYAEAASMVRKTSQQELS